MKVTHETNSVDAQNIWDNVEAFYVSKIYQTNVQTHLVMTDQFKISLDSDDSALIHSFITTSHIYVHNYLKIYMNLLEQ